MLTSTKERLYLLTVILLIAISGQFYYSYHYIPRHEVDVYYSKEKELNEEINRVIRDADKFVYFAVYTFTKKDIKDALLGAKYRGLDVVGISDKNQYASLESQRKIIDELREAGIPVYEQSHSAIMHLKTVVTEKAYASGSYNWTNSATDSNDEVLEIGRDDGTRKKYENILKEMFDRYN